MSRPYITLRALPAEAFLKPEDFVTGYDTIDPSYGEEQYRKGLAISKASKRVGVSMGGTWFAEGKDGSHTTSYEGVGYHAHTASLLRGFLAGPAEVVVERIGGKSTVIKPESKE